MDFKDYILDNDDDDLPTLPFPIPDTSISTIGPEIINRLDFMVFEKTKTLSPHFLKYALDNCPQLSYLEISSFYANKRKYIFEATEYDQRRKTDNSSTKPNHQPLKYITLRAVEYLQDELDLIFTHLSNAISIKCQGTTRYSVTCGYNDLDLTGFGDLNEFSIDVGKVLNSDVDYVFTVVDYAVSNAGYYMVEESDVEGRQYPYKFTPITADFLSGTKAEDSLTVWTLSLKCNSTIKRITFFRSPLLPY